MGSSKIIELLGQLLSPRRFNRQVCCWPLAVKTIVGALDKIAEVVAAFINSTPAGFLSKLFGIDAGAAAANGIRQFASGIESLATLQKRFRNTRTSC